MTFLTCHVNISAWGDNMSIGKRIKLARESLKLTQSDIAKKVGVATQTIFKYENEIVTNIPLDKLEKIADALNTTPAYLMGWTDLPGTTAIDPFSFDNIHPISTQKIPLLGSIACGEPVFADEERESYVEASTEIKADFCLKAKGDSMIGARIMDGDIVFIRNQPSVENGEIAAVIIDDEATLKRVFYYPEKNTLILKPENSKYRDFVYVGEELDSIRILGKAVAFQSDAV